MKKIRLFITLGFILTFSISGTYAQVAINSDGSAPNNTAMLDIKSITRGLLPPRMNQSQREGILSPATGLVVFDTDANCLYLRTATAWVPLFTSATAWGLNGNAGTTPGTNFIGTTDGKPLMFKVNNQNAGHIDYDQNKANTGFGYQALSISTGGTNTANGYWALFSNTIGEQNTAIGYKALYSNISGIRNTAIGREALLNNTLGNNNTAIGIAALGYNNTGYYNTALGSMSLLSNSTGKKNTSTGGGSLQLNTEGYFNTANGADALRRNNTGYQNTAVGDSAGYTNTTGQNNTYIGYNAIGSPTLTNATAIGANTLVTQSNSMVLGDNNVNVGIGTSAPANKLEVANGGISLYNNADTKRFVMNYDQTGHYFYIDEYGAGRHFTILNGGNVGIGTTSPAAKLDVNGSFKLFNGTQAAGTILTGDANGLASWKTPSAAGSWGTTGNAGTTPGTNFIGTTDNIPLTFKVNNQLAGTIDQNNTAVGYQSLAVNTSGAANVAFGQYSLFNNTLGESNTAVGRSALFNNNTGSFNTGIGQWAYSQSEPIDNWTGLGYNVGENGSISNSVEIGNTSVTRIQGEVPFTTYSDGRIKDNITADVPGLDFIKKLRPVTYNLNIHRQNEMMYKGKKEDKNWPGKYDIEKIKMTGFVAQEVEQAANQCDYDFSGVQKPKTADGLYGLSYSDFVVPLVKGMQEQQTIIEIQNRKIDELIKRIEALENK